MVVCVWCVDTRVSLFHSHSPNFPIVLKRRGRFRFRQTLLRPDIILVVVTIVIWKKLYGH